MKLLLTVLLLLSVSMASAKDHNKETHAIIAFESITMDSTPVLVINVKGIKTMEEIDIENYNKSNYLSLIVFKKQEPQMC
ncbi:hypothetical protein N7U66_00985 [Lacinutrix neustonica]|uniref:Uncharacterized protein n=1 Tax=Lacinutrix neustonica TaxID=2980107 RepID=A0A9E8MXH5_9FLAO|nr:hypothetical protein [Lacinutrix neustonica]WAC02352.1 hypothetical protein N7U66_00985 [Lacinutrix neustonica]